MCTALSRHYRRATTEWDIEERTNAAPLIHNLPVPAHISLSHSHHLICFGLSSFRIGIDVEWMKSGRRFREMAALFMSNEEVALLPEHPAELQRYFYRIWCAKEALYKALTPAEQARTTLTGLSYPALLENDSPWHLMQSRLDHYRLAVVSEKVTAAPLLHQASINLEHVMRDAARRGLSNHKKGPDGPFGILDTTETQ
ncbi:4'-phosphopantetheinyl transferase family protein [Oceanimonas doudoroffii]|nr:4'-phosphopantetheinyl transferase superfamily protein [Oceanimonas doudoroffii]